jgi:conjugal transfer pilus assembly protein TraD
VSHSDSLVEQFATAFAPTHALFAWLADTTATGLVGFAAGALAARGLRLAGLRWSWGAVALAVAVLLRALLAGLAPAVVLAAFVATRRGRRRHLDELDAGGDLADRAAARRGPAELMRACASALELRRRRRAGDRRWFRGDQLILGVDQRRTLVTVPLGGERSGSHMLVVGATGSGKTVTQTWVATRAVERGMGAVVIDPKGDPAMHAALVDAAAQRQRPFVEWTPDGPSVYNPFAHGGETEIADKLLAGERFSEPHYMRQAQRYVGHVVRALRGAGFEVSLQAVAYHLEPRRLELLLADLPPASARGTRDYLESLSARQTADLAGVRDRLAILAESDVGRWLDPAQPAARFDLLQAVQQRAVVYFDLTADRRPLLTQMLGAAIVQDLTTTVAALQRAPLPTAVVIDEFSSLAAEQIVRLFGRARSAGMSLVLGAQELADLRLPGREALLEQVLGNLTVLVAHRQVVPRSAELVAGLSGAAGAWRTSRHGDGRVTRTRIRESVLAPADVSALGPGTAATIVLGSASRASITRIFSLESKELR